MKIRARCIVEGEARAEVLYSSKPIAFLQGVDPEKGIVSDPKHEIYGNNGLWLRDSWHPAVRCY
ncbi:MAG: hypothetical protein M1368_08470 [Thaumarchaeota archaeon]|nr:hypothetical protein [Nitrososphaerota archaeon]